MKKLKRVIIKEELVELTGDFKKAIVLQQMIYWSERTKDADKFIRDEMNRSKMAMGKSEIEYSKKLEEVDLMTHGWIYKSAEELSEETMLDVSKSTMGRYLNELVKNKWLDKRKNPKWKGDNTYQYRVNLIQIQKDLNKLGYHLEGYANYFSEFQNEISMSNDETSECQNEIGSSKIKQPVSKSNNQFQNETTLPEITTETTTDICSINQSFKSENSKDNSNNKNDRKKDRKNITNNFNNISFKEILDNSNYNDFEEKYSVAIEQALRLLFFSDKYLQINNMKIPVEQVRGDLKRLRWKHLDIALRDFKNSAELQEIRNPIAYLSRCIYNAIFQGELKIEAELKYNNLI